MNRDSQLIYEAYYSREEMNRERPIAADRRVKVKKMRHEITPPPERDPSKSQTYNKIISLNYEFDKDVKTDQHYKEIADKLNQEKFESIAFITKTTVDQVKDAVDNGIDPASAIYRPVSDPLQRTDNLSSEE